MQQAPVQRSTYVLNGVLYVRELEDRDETFFFGRQRAGQPVTCPECLGRAVPICITCKGKSTVPCSVVVFTIRRGREIPIMEFDALGRYSEVLAPRMRASIASMMVERVFDLSTVQRTLSQRERRDLQFNAGLLKWYEKQGGRV